jgi:hypothetical protein
MDERAARHKPDRALAQRFDGGKMRRERPGARDQ